MVRERERERVCERERERDRGREKERERYRQRKRQAERFFFPRGIVRQIMRWEFFSSQVGKSHLLPRDVIITYVTFFK